MLAINYAVNVKEFCPHDLSVARQLRRWEKGKQGEKENVVYFLVVIHVDYDKTFALQLCNKVILGDSSTSNLELCFLLSQRTVAEILNRKLSWSGLVQ